VKVKKASLYSSTDGRLGGLPILFVRLPEPAAFGFKIIPPLLWMIKRLYAAELLFT